jgi:uncharacterized protein (TIGR02265 family)
MDTAEALAQRIEAATAQDVVLGMFLESTLAYVQERHGAAAAQGLRHDVLGSRTLVGFLRYPVVDLLRMIDRVGRAQEGDAATFHDRVCALAEVGVQRFFASPVGRTMAMLAARSPHRLLQSAPSGYRAVCSFGVWRYTRTGERSAELACAGDLLGPAWQTCAVTHAMQVVCDVTPRVDVTLLDAAGTHYVLRVTW